MGHETPTTWRGALRAAGLAYLFSRLCVMIGAALIAAELRADEKVRIEKFGSSPWADPDYARKVIPKNALRPMLDVLTSWDGVWYLRIVRLGYPTFVRPNVDYDVWDARAAFFPLYPACVKALDALLPGGDIEAALLLNFCLGAVAVVLVGILTRRLYGESVALKAMVLMAMFPGAFVLSFAYTEALLIVLAAGCLWALGERRWWLAGALAALATATRPNGVALVVACAVAAVVAVRERREWRSLVALVVSPMGFIGFMLWIDHRVAERGVWFRVQTEAWGEGTSFGWTAVRRTAKAIAHPLSSPTNTITLASVAALVLLVWFLRRHPLPAPMVAYSLAVVVLMLLPATVTARPRFLYTAFPLLIPAAVWLDRDRRGWWTWAMASCAAGLVALTTLYGAYGAIP